MPRLEPDRRITFTADELDCLERAAAILRVLADQEFLRATGGTSSRRLAEGIAHLATAARSGRERFGQARPQD